MRFDAYTLHSTSRAFHAALKRKGIKLKPTTAYSIWSRGLFGKDYSPICSNLNSGSAIYIEKISPLLLQLRNSLNFWKIDANIEEITTLFVESTKDYLVDICPDLTRIVEYGEKKDVYFIASITPKKNEAHGTFRVALIEHGKPGKQDLKKPVTHSAEESEVYANLLNAYTNSESADNLANVFASAVRESDNRSNDQFIALITKSRKSVADRLSHAVWDNDGSFIKTMETLDDSKQLTATIDDELEQIFSELRESKEAKFLSTDSPLPYDFIRLTTQYIIEHVTYFRDVADQIDEIERDNILQIVNLCIERIYSSHRRGEE